MNELFHDDSDSKDPNEISEESEPEIVDDQINEVTENRNGESQTEETLRQTLVRLGFINFDAGSVANATTNAMVSSEYRQDFRRDVYVGIRDAEQNREFLGRVVEGPFHTPHEVGSESAITRTTVLHPDRTQFRPTYFVEGTIEVLGQLSDGERLVPTPTRPRPYSEIYIFPAERLQRYLGISGTFNLGHLMGYERLSVMADINSKNFLPRNVGIFGTVGSGKSNTTQVIIEEATRHGWAVVAIDVEGEYVRMNEATDDENMNQLLDNRFGLQANGLDDFNFTFLNRATRRHVIRSGSKYRFQH